MLSKNNPDALDVNFILCLIAFLIKQSTQSEYSSVNDINDIYSSIMLFC